MLFGDDDDTEGSGADAAPPAYSPCSVASGGEDSGADAAEVGANIVPVGDGVVAQCAKADLSGVALGLAEQLLSHRAYAETSGHIVVRNLAHWSVAAQRELESHGLVEIREDELGELTLAFRMNAVRFSGHSRMTDPVVLAAMPSRQLPTMKLSNLEMAQDLLHQGWRAHEAPPPYKIGEPKAFLARELLETTA